MYRPGWCFSEIRGGELVEETTASTPLDYYASGELERGNEPGPDSLANNKTYKSYSSMIIKDMQCIYCHLIFINTN
jgi:hypothetical protein